MTLNYTFTWPEWFRIQRLFSRSYYRWPVIGAALYYFSRYFLTALGLFATVASILIMVTFPKRSAEVFPMLVIGIVWLAITLWARYSQKKRFSQMLTSNLVTTIDDSGIHVVRPGEAETRYQWTAVKKTAEDDKYFILLLSKIVFIPIPKRAMTAEQQSELRTLIAANVATYGTERISPTQQ